MANGTKRSRNFTENEKQYLLFLVERHKDIITSKKLSACEINRKNREWEVITEAYNRNCTTGKRNASQLRHFYRNIKHRGKMYLNEENKKLDEHPLTKSSLNLLHVNGKNNSSQEFMVSVNGCRVPGSPHEDDPLASDDKVEEIVCHSTAALSALGRGRPPPARRRLSLTRTATAKPRTSEYLKRIYYKHKIELVKLQKRNELARLCNDKEKHDIEMQILRMQVEMVNEGSDSD